MRNCMIGCVLFFTMVATAFSETQELPKELVIDLGGDVKLELVLIPAGSFMMGDDVEKPVHKVTITKPYYLGKYEVTQEQWEAVMGHNPSLFITPKSPAELVSWESCQRFCERLNVKHGSHGSKFLLPTEAQWEYACRAGSTGRFFFGDDEKQLDEYAWYEKNSGKTTHPVGEKKPNAFGLYDMYGNVNEWCRDYYDDFGAKAEVIDPTGPTTGSDRVLRGGAWIGFTRYFGSANRSYHRPKSEFLSVGLRVARVQEEADAEASVPKSVSQGKEKGRYRTSVHRERTGAVRFKRSTFRCPGVLGP